jgi:hypothetical protein
MGGPALQIIDPQGIFLADLFGLILSLPVALFIAYWMSDVKNHLVVVLGAFIGAFLAFLIILGWVGTLIYDSVLPGANPGSTFFGSIIAGRQRSLTNNERRNEQCSFSCTATTNLPAGNS